MMKKTYIAPSVEIEEIIMTQGACLTVGSGGSGTPGEEGDVKASNEDWNIWSDEE